MAPVTAKVFRVCSIVKFAFATGWPHESGSFSTQIPAAYSSVICEGFPVGHDQPYVTGTVVHLALGGHQQFLIVAHFREDVKRFGIAPRPDHRDLLTGVP
jgi:hypothetical protein